MWGKKCYKFKSTQLFLRNKLALQLLHHDGVRPRGVPRAVRDNCRHRVQRVRRAHVRRNGAHLGVHRRVSGGQARERREVGVRQLRPRDVFDRECGRVQPLQGEFE